MAAITSSTWATGTSYTAGDYVVPTSPGNYWYRANNTGTSNGTTEPTWPTTPGGTVVDNNITWICVEVFQLVPDFTFSWGQEDDTIIVEFESGAEQRTTGTRAERMHFACQFTNRSDSDITTMATFWTAQGGRRHTWVFQDPRTDSYYLVRFAGSRIDYNKDAPAAIGSWSFDITERGA